MCDTWVALSSSTQTNNVIFAKNSDRPIYDCQPLLFRPRQNWPAGSRVRTEYLELPQIETTHAHLGSSPYWCWGYEEGINEYGVAIGNEAIYTKTFRESTRQSNQGQQADFGLLGMDLIRLALERSQTARQAVELIGRLIEQYGQAGSGVPGKDHLEGGYDNSFIVADPLEAWILEAAGRCWVARRLSQGFTSISNQPVIRSEWDLASRDVQEYAIGKGWWSHEAQTTFDFAQAYCDEQVPRQVSHLRLMRSRQLLAERNGQITPEWMMRIARDHYEGTFLEGPYFNAADPDFLSLCMHVSPAGFTWGNTASSCVAVLPASELDLPVFWWTPGPPCNGCYVPFFVHGSRLPKIVSQSGLYGKKVLPAQQAGEDHFSPDSYWWLFRRLMDIVKGDPIYSPGNYYEERNLVVRERFNTLEQDFLVQTPTVVAQAAHLRQIDQGAAARLLDDFTTRCIQMVVAALQDLMKTFSEHIIIQEAEELR